MKNEPTRGRQPLPEGVAATSQIQLRVQTKRKAAYVRTASKQGKTLTAWMLEACDKASGYEDTFGNRDYADSILEHQVPCSALWAVMKAHAWDSITAHGLPLKGPPEGPHRFIPVFTTREQAVAWAGSDEHVAMLMLKAQREGAIARLS